MFGERPNFENLDQFHQKMIEIFPALVGWISLDKFVLDIDQLYQEMIDVITSKILLFTTKLLVYFQFHDFVA